jgi:hypothetical protein
VRSNKGRELHNITRSLAGRWDADPTVPNWIIGSYRCADDEMQVQVPSREHFFAAP